MEGCTEKGSEGNVAGKTHEQERKQVGEGNNEPNVTGPWMIVQKPRRPRKGK